MSARPKGQPAARPKGQPAPAGQEPFVVHRYAGGHSQIVGYARVSTRDQSLQSQLIRLEQAACCRVYAEKCSSVGDRPGWAALVDQLRKGDTVAVVRLDRIGRRLGEVVECVDGITRGGAHVHALEQGIDTRSPHGRLILPIFAALAETERAILRERTRAGLEAARAEGRRGGRPRKRSDVKDAMARSLRAQGFSVSQIAKVVEVSPALVRAILRDAEPDDPRQLRLAVDVAVVRAAAAAAASPPRK